MNRCVLVCIVTVLAVAAWAVPARGQGTFPLKWVDANPKELPSDLACSAYLSHDLPAGLKAAPKGLPDYATYGATTLGGRQVIFALDTLSTSGSSTARLYIDASGKADLTGIKPLVTPMPKVTSRAFNLSKLKPTDPAAPPAAEAPPEPPAEALDMTPLDFGTFELPGAAKDGAKAVKVRLQMPPGMAMASFAEWLTYDRLVITPAGYMAGEVKLGGEAYSVALLDGDMDGRYETAAAGKGGTWLWIDLNGDGKMAQAETYTGEFWRLRPMVRVKGVYYSVTVPPDGSSIKLEKVKPEMGTVDAGSKDVGLVLDTAVGPMRLAAGPGSWPVPAGPCSAASFSLTRTDTAGARWTLTDLSNNGPIKDFEVLPGKTAALKVGPPLEIKVTVESGGQDGMVYLTCDVRGQAGERYLAGASADDLKPVPPDFKILDESGKVLEVGTFDFT